MTHRYSPRFLTATALTLTFGLAAAPAALAGAGTGTPQVPAKPSMAASTTRRPATMYLGDISGEGLGTNRHHIRWSSWGHTRAVGTGIETINTCEPSCAAGHYDRVPAKIVLTDPKVIHGTLMFKNLTLVYTKKKPTGAEWTHWVDIYLKGAAGGPGVREWLFRSH